MQLLQLFFYLFNFLFKLYAENLKYNYFIMYKRYLRMFIDQVQYLFVGSSLMTRYTVAF